jgi:hypothetical protein
MTIISKTRIARRIAPLAAAAAVAWSMAPALGLGATGAGAPPEPTSMMLLGGGLLVFAALVRRGSLQR